MSNQRKQCCNCRQIYIGDGYKDSCTRDCYFKKQYAEKMKSQGITGKRHQLIVKKIYNSICPVCNEPFEYNSKVIKYCIFGCAKAVKSGRMISQEDKIKAANAKWLEPKKPRKKGKSFAQLNREAEWRRVWDDESWTRNFNANRG